MKRGQMVEGIKRDTHQKKRNNTDVNLKMSQEKVRDFYMSKTCHLVNRKENIMKVLLT